MEQEPTTREQLSKEQPIDVLLDYKQVLTDRAHHKMYKDIPREHRAALALHWIGFNKTEIANRLPLSYSTIKRILTPFPKKV